MGVFCMEWAGPSGSGRIAVFQRDVSTGDISDVGCVAEGAADGCASGFGLDGAAGIAISPDGKNVYVASAFSNSVSTFTRDPATGALSKTGCIGNGGAEGCTAAAGLRSATGIAVSPDGANVYVTSEVRNAVVRLARDTSSGALSWSGCVAEAPAETGYTTAAGLTHAENVIVSADGDQVYVTGYGTSPYTNASVVSSRGAPAAHSVLQAAWRSHRGGLRAR